MLRFLSHHAGLAMLLLVCATVPPLSGQALKDAVGSLRAGGNTIAGPGIYNRPAPSSLAIWRSRAGEPGTSLCVTVTNVGAAVVGTEFTPGPPDSLVVPAGVTISNCADNVTSVLINCTALSPGDQCKVAWRIDKK